MSMWTADMADVARAAGLTVIETPGWKTRGTNYRGGQVALNGLIDHHTATPDKFPGDMPTLKWLMFGGTNYPPPVANWGLGRSGICYAVAAGRANHAGPVHAHLRGTFGNGRSHGIEAENSGVSGPWPDVQMEAYARLTAAYHLYYGVSYDAHKNVRPGKVDPSFDWPEFVAEVERHARILRAHGFSKGKYPAEPVSLTATEEAASVWTTPEGDDPAYLHMGHLHPKVAEIQTWATGKWAWARAILDTYGVDEKFGRNTRTLVATLQERLNRQAARDKWAGWTPLDVDGKWGPATEAAARAKSEFRKPAPAPKPPKEAPVTPTPYKAFPIARTKDEFQSIEFGMELAERIHDMGYKITCGPADQKAGRCAPGKHPHGRTSWHFKAARGETGWAIDISRNYGGPVSDREKAYLSSVGFLLTDLYGHLGFGYVLDRAPNDHEDHGHGQSAPMITPNSFRPSMEDVPEGVVLYGMGRREMGGAFSDRVKALQQSLGVKADGVFGIATFDAVRAAQSKAGITVDGIAGPATKQAVTR